MPSSLDVYHQVDVVAVVVADRFDHRPGRVGTLDLGSVEAFQIIPQVVPEGFQPILRVVVPGLVSG